MSSFANFVSDIVAQQVAYYEQGQREYNKDPFSVRYKTQMTVDRVFPCPENAGLHKDWKSLTTSRKLDTLATEYENSLLSEERVQRGLFHKHRDALALKEYELAKIKSAGDTVDPVLSALSNDPIVKSALLQYRQYGLDRFRYVSKACLLAVADPTTRAWFFPMQFPPQAVRLESSLFVDGDAVGSMDQDCDATRRSRVPHNMSLPRDKELVWFQHLNNFYPRDLLEHTPWGSLAREGVTRYVSDPGREIVHAMVVTRQVATFYGQGEKLSPSSYCHVDRLHAAFSRYVKVQFVDPALEAIRRRFDAVDWSNLCMTALQHLPVFLSCDAGDHGDGVECLFTGKTNDLVRVTVVRCSLLDWDPRERFEEYTKRFTAKYTRGLQRWWHACTDHGIVDRGYGVRLGGRRRLSSCSSTSSSSSVMPGENSRHRGRTTAVANGYKEKIGDIDGFVVDVWSNNMIVHRSVANLIVHAWRLTHLNWWIDATLLQWKREKSSFYPTNEDTIYYVTDTVMTALRQCQTANESW